MAAILAFKEAYGKCRPVLLEPIMKVRIVVAAQYLGDVISDVSTRRGRISGMEGNDTTQIVEAFIPEAEIIEYSMNLSSLTQGNGVFTREFAGYEEVPSHLVDKIIKEANL
jgi:elongation factor G